MAPRRLVVVVLMTCLLGGCSTAPRVNGWTRARSFDQLWSTLRRDYAYFGRLLYEGPGNPYEFRKKHRPNVVSAQTLREYLIAMGRFLAELNDPHVQFVDLSAWYEGVTGQPVSSPFSDGTAAGGSVWISLDHNNLITGENDPALPEQQMYELLAMDGVPVVGLGPLPFVCTEGDVVELKLLLIDYTERIVRVRCPEAPATDESEKEEDEDARVSYRRRKDGKIGYIYLNNVDDAKTTAAFDRALDDLMDTDALVLDLTNNSGGCFDVVEDILGRFVDGVKPFVGLLRRADRMTLSGLLPIDYTGAAWAQSRGAVYRKPLAVLISYRTVSGGEVLAIALQELRNSVLIGERTAGGGAGTNKIMLSGGLSIKYSILPFYRLDGRSCQYLGIKPDVPIRLDRRAVAREGKDAIQSWWTRAYNRAIEILRRHDATTE